LVYSCIFSTQRMPTLDAALRNPEYNVLFGEFRQPKYILLP